MGKQMAKSWEAPQYTLFTTIHCEGMISYRKSLPFKTSYTTILLKAVAETIAAFPIFNCSWDDGKQLISHDSLNMGVAVDTKRGLLVPVIQNAGNLTLEGLNEEMEKIKLKAESGSFTLEELSGGTFIVSNLGMFSVTEFTAIVNAPNSAILSVGKMKEVPIVKNGAIEIGRTMEIGLNMDHRVIDGATGAKFLTKLVEYLEALK